MRRRENPPKNRYNNPSHFPPPIYKPVDGKNIEQLFFRMQKIFNGGMSLSRISGSLGEMTAEEREKGQWYTFEEVKAFEGHVLSKKRHRRDTQYTYMVMTSTYKSFKGFVKKVKSIYPQLNP